MAVLSLFSIHISISCWESAMPFFYALIYLILDTYYTGTSGLCLEKNSRQKYGFEIDFVRKYLLCGYILGVLMHTTAWDRHLEGDETLK